MQQKTNLANNVYFVVTQFKTLDDSHGWFAEQHNRFLYKAPFKRPNFMLQMFFDQVNLEVLKKLY